MRLSQEKTLLLKCTQIIKDTADVKTFRFINQQKAQFSFKAGQFITLKLNINNQAYQRCYSISSSPEDDHYIDLTVKKVPNGVVSHWLLDHLKTGDQIEAVQPTGTFHLNNTDNKNLMLISAGSGITPMLSMLKLLDGKNDYDIKFHHSARTYNDLIAHHELAAICQQNPGFDLSYNFSREHVSDINAANIFNGRITKHILSSICNDIQQRDVFVCGPPLFMAQVQASLQSLGLPAAQYFQESFELTPIETQIHDHPEMFDLTFIHSNISMKIAANQTVLEAAEEAGIHLDYSCSSGICGSCTSYLQQGEIHAPQASALDDSDIENGDFLPCCSFARSDLVVDL